MTYPFTGVPRANYPKPSSLYFLPDRDILTRQWRVEWAGGELDWRGWKSIATEEESSRMVVTTLMEALSKWLTQRDFLPFLSLLQTFSKSLCEKYNQPEGTATPCPSYRPHQPHPIPVFCTVRANPLSISVPCHILFPRPGMFVHQPIIPVLWTNDSHPSNLNINARFLGCSTTAPYIVPQATQFLPKYFQSPQLLLSQWKLNSYLMITCLFTSR